MRSLLPFLVLLCIAPAVGQAGAQQKGPVGEFRNEAVVVNGSRWVVEVVVTPKDPSMALQGMQFSIQPRDTIRIADYFSAGDFRSPIEMVTVRGTVRNLKGKTNSIGVMMNQKRQVSKQHRKWYYEVMPSGGSVGFSF